MPIRRLIIIDTPLQYLESDVFLGISNTSLQQIHLMRTSLIELPVSALSVLSSSLTQLHIEWSQLNSVPSRSFSGLHLEELRLTNANISELMSDAFAGLDKLKTLDLHGNQLKDIPKGIFLPLRNLEVLDVASNSLAKLQPHYFSDLAKLVSVNVSSNGLTEYPRGVFARNTVNIKEFCNCIAYFISVLIYVSLYSKIEVKFVFFCGKFKQLVVYRTMARQERRLRFLHVV